MPTPSTRTARSSPGHWRSDMVGDYYYGTGRRKSSVARVFLKPGKGQFEVNGKPVCPSEKTIIDRVEQALD